MRIENICGSIFLVVWTLGVMWFNYEWWFRAEKNMEEMQERSAESINEPPPFTATIAWTRVAGLVAAVATAIFLCQAFS